MTDQQPEALRLAHQIDIDLGYGGGCSSETARAAMNALISQHAEIERLRAEVDGLRRIPDNMGYMSIEKDGPVGMALQWLHAALDCKAWSWDADQRECAEQSLEDAKKWMKLLGEVPDQCAMQSTKEQP